MEKNKGIQEMERLLIEYMEKYDKLMDPHFYSAKTLAELTCGHDSSKKEVLQEVLRNWMTSSHGNTKNDFSKKLSTEIDKRFLDFTKHFEVAQKREQNKVKAQLAKNDALHTYDTSMEGIMKNNPHLTPEEVRVFHEEHASRAMKFAKSSGGVGFTSPLVAELRTELELRKKIHMERAKMNVVSRTDSVIGIDLGTTVCCAAVYLNGEVQIIPNRGQNSNFTPSYVAYLEDGTDTFGHVAKEEAYMYPETTIYDAKRMIGRRWDDKVLKIDRCDWQFEMINDLGNPKIVTWGRTRYPHEISAKLLHAIRIMADDFLGKPRGTIRKAVITVPAYFSDPQRKATKEAAMCAGIDVLNLLSEPTAAALAYNWQKREQERQNILVYDLGGGTFDVSIAAVVNGDIEILATDGNTHLGGHDIDRILVKYCIQEFLKKENINLEEGKNSLDKFVRDEVRSSLTRLRLQCERVKERLSSAETSRVEISRIRRNINLNIPLTRSKLDELITPLILQSLEIVERAIGKASKSGINSKMDIHNVILVGGSTRIPLVKKLIKDFFNGKDPIEYINPDEAVAYGAAVQAALYNKSPGLRNVQVLDVTPMSLGVEIIGERFSKIIENNTRIPCTYSQIYRTVYANQTSAEVIIYQGENEKSTDNKWLGTFLLEGFLPKPAGEEKAQITMGINEMGILHVEAVSLSTGKQNAITITSDRLGMDRDSMNRLRQQFQTNQL